MWGVRALDCLNRTREAGAGVTESPYDWVSEKEHEAGSSHCHCRCDCRSRSGSHGYGRTAPTRPVPVADVPALIGRYGICGVEAAAGRRELQPERADDAPT